MSIHPYRAWPRVLIFGLLAHAATLLAAPAAESPAAIRRIEGRAYATADHRLLYRESHWIYRDGNEDVRLVLYRCPDGKPFARKRLQAHATPQAPDFTLEDGRSGYREGVRSTRGGREVFVRDSGSVPERSAPLKMQPLPVIDAGFDAFIRMHWNDLAQGANLDAPFVLPSRLGTLDFRISRQPDMQLDGHVARVYRIGLASWVGFALPHLEVRYDEASRELRRFDGMANIRGDNGKNVNVQIDLKSVTEAATSAGIQQALAAPLDGRCPIH